MPENVRKGQAEAACTLDCGGQEEYIDICMKKILRNLHPPFHTSPDSARLFQRSRVFRHPGLSLGVFPSPAQGLLDYHIHENFSELVLITEGTGEHEIAGRRYPIVAGDVFLVSGNQPHCYSDGYGLSLINVVFHWDEVVTQQYDIGEIAAFQSLFVIDPANDAPDRFDHRFRLAADDFNAVLGIVREMDRLLNAPQPRPGMRFLATSLFLSLIAKVLDAYERTAASGVTESVPHRLGALAARMEQHCADRFTVKAMCREAGMSYASLFRCFRRYYRDSPVNYLLKQRLRRAEELLRGTPERPVGEIALACGFSDSAYFARKFHEHYQMPPSVYRRKFGKASAGTEPETDRPADE